MCAGSRARAKIFHAFSLPYRARDPCRLTKPLDRGTVTIMADDDDNAQAAAPKRGPGRPPKLKQCQVCTYKKPARAFYAYSPFVCIDCTRNGHTIASIPTKDRHLIPSTERQSEIFTDVIGLRKINKLLSEFTAGFLRCACCFTGGPYVKHVEIADRDFCAVCAYQIEVCGRCETHRSVQFVPALEAARAPHVPLEVRALFEAQIDLRSHDTGLARALPEEMGLASSEET